MRRFISGVAGCVGLALLVGCTAGQQSSAYGSRSCGLLGCVSSSYLKARLSPAIVGQPVATAIQAAGGAPSSSYTDAGGTEYLTWQRVQQDGGSQYACTESVSARGGIVVGYRFDGHC